MKKYIYTLCLIVLIIYSCKTRPNNVQSITATTNTADFSVSTKVDFLKKGETLYNENCGSCHKLHSPSEFTSEEWIPIMNAMATEAKLTPEEKNWVLAYVNANAKK